MDVIVIFNGLGNQMSQYAFYLAKCKKNRKCNIIFDPESQNRHNGSELEMIFNIKYPKNWVFIILERILLLSKNRFFKCLFYLLGIRFLIEPRNYDFTPNLLEEGRSLVNFYIGGWHSEKYFLDIKQDVLESFVFHNKGENKIDQFEWVRKTILSSNNSVSLHVRRGDFLNASSDDFYQFGGVATTEYYKTAIDYIKGKIQNVDFFVFSNDIAWCKEEFGYAGFTYIECNSGPDSWRDLYLMTLCKHHINANSTFSWWGAWLTENEHTIVICPNQFIKNVLTKDIYPERWTRISETGVVIIK